MDVCEFKIHPLASALGVCPHKYYSIKRPVAIPYDHNSQIFSNQVLSGAGIDRSSALKAENQNMTPRDQNRELYFSTPGTYTVYARKTNGVAPSFNIGNPSFIWIW